MIVGVDKQVVKHQRTGAGVRCQMGGGNIADLMCVRGSRVRRP